MGFEAQDIAVFTVGIGAFIFIAVMWWLLKDTDDV